MVCEACGSIDVARSRSSRLDQLIRFFTGRKRFSCKRCGWTARRKWDEATRPDWTKPTSYPKPTLVPPRKEGDDFDIDRFD